MEMRCASPTTCLWYFTAKLRQEKGDFCKKMPRLAVRRQVRETEPSALALDSPVLTHWALFSNS